MSMNMRSYGKSKLMGVWMAFYSIFSKYDYEVGKIECGGSDLEKFKFGRLDSVHNLGKKGGMYFAEFSFTIFYGVNNPFYTNLFHNI